MAFGAILGSSPSVVKSGPLTLECWGRMKNVSPCGTRYSAWAQVARLSCSR